MAGTEAAASMLLDDAIMQPFIRQITARDGSLKPFELLIKTGSLGAEPLPAKIVARRLTEQEDSSENAAVGRLEGHGGGRKIYCNRRFIVTD